MSLKHWKEFHSFRNVLDVSKDPIGNKMKQFDISNIIFYVLNDMYCTYEIILIWIFEFEDRKKRINQIFHRVWILQKIRS